MADESMQSDPAAGESDTIDTDTQIPVRLDSLEADGTRPAVGDSVTVKLEGTVKKIENDYAYVQVDAINDTDINEILADTGDSGDTDDEGMMRKLATQADMGQALGMGGGGYG